MSQERVSLVLHRKEFQRELGNKVKVVYRIKICSVDSVRCLQAAVGFVSSALYYGNKGEEHSYLFSDGVAFSGNWACTPFLSCCGPLHRCHGACGSVVQHGMYSSDYNVAGGYLEVTFVTILVLASSG